MVRVYSLVLLSLVLSIIMVTGRDMQVGGFFTLQTSSKEAASSSSMAFFSR